MIQIKNLTKTYGSAPDAPHALDDVSIDVADGDIMGIIGMSGAGKSTLVRCINLLERPDSGQILVDGQDVTGLTGAPLRAYRRRVAMIFQNFGLLAQKTVLANVCFPYKAAAGRVTAANRERALELLDMVGLRDRADSYPSQLSGGDPASTNTVLKLLRQINRETGVTVIVITHSMGVVEKICRNVVVLEHGHVVERGSVADVFADPQSQAAKVLLERVDWDA